MFEMIDIQARFAPSRVQATVCESVQMLAPQIVSSKFDTDRSPANIFSPTSTADTIYVEQRCPKNISEYISPEREKNLDLCKFPSTINSDTNCVSRRTDVFCKSKNKMADS
uniref:Uncharacterized protein n=1 Tax=Arion vulgaris TaxID=1028688 RepID=A0A0B6Z401_9EUPU